MTTRGGWASLIKEANRDNKKLNLLVDYLFAAEKAKLLLQENGYGYAGMDILETTKEVVKYKEESWQKGND